MGINYFYALKLVGLVHEITNIDFSENNEDFEKFRNLTKEEASKLRYIINVRPNILKDYVYKNIIKNDNTF